MDDKHSNKLMNIGRVKGRNGRRPLARLRRAQREHDADSRELPGGAAGRGDQGLGGGRRHRQQDLVRGERSAT